MLPPIEELPRPTGANDMSKKTVHDELHDLARRIYTAHGVLLHDVQFDWVTTTGGGAHLVSTHVTTKQPNHGGSQA